MHVRGRAARVRGKGPREQDVNKARGGWDALLAMLNLRGDLDQTRRARTSD